MPVTNKQLMDAMKDSRSELTAGIKGVHERLDVLNGRTRKSEEYIGRHDERIKALESKPSGIAQDMPLLKNGDWKTLSLIGAILAGTISGLVQGLYKVAAYLGVIGGK